MSAKDILKLLISIFLDFLDDILELIFDATTIVPVANAILWLVEIIGTFPWKIFLGIVGIIFYGPLGALQFLEIFSSRIPLLGTIPILTIVGIIHILRKSS